MELVVIPLALLLIAGMLLRRGWGGRTIGDHPVCRRCGFDLFGLPEGGEICSECGADVTLRKATRFGHRQHRGGLLGAGAVLLLIAVAWFAVVGVAVYSGANLQPYKPLWYLAREMRSADVATRDAAL